MIDPVAFNTGMRALLSSLAGVTVADPLDATQRFPPRTGADAFTTLTFKIRSSRRVGRDEIRAAYNPTLHPEDDTYAGDGAPLGAIVYTVTGQREYTLEVRAECDLAVASAWPFVERVRDRLQLPSTRYALAALGLAVQRAGEVRDMAYPNAGRTLSAAVLEVVLNGVSNETEAFTTIEDFTYEIVPGA